MSSRQVESQENPPVWYDESLQQNQVQQYFFRSLGNAETLTGHLLHHSRNEDGSFGICVASGSGIYVAQRVWESIPQEHRPRLNEADRQSVPNVLFGSMRIEAIGSVIMPVVFSEDGTGIKFCVKLRALVCPSLTSGMFISFPSGPSGLIQGMKWGNPPGYLLRMADGRTVKVTGKMLGT